MQERYLPYMSWVDVEEKLEEGLDTVIFPLGATEQHGRHAPLGTDSFIGLEVAVRVARITDALVAPTLVVGYSPQHLRWPGSVTLSADTFQSVLSDMVTSLHGQGFKRMVFLSAHGGNRVPASMAARGLKHKMGESVQIVLAEMLGIQAGAGFKAEAEAALGMKLSDPWGAHAGEQETSAVMYFKPELVRLDRCAAPAVPGGYLSKTRDPDVSAVIFNLPRYTESGTWGDARNASPLQGEVFYDLISRKLAEKIQAAWEN